MDREVWLEIVTRNVEHIFKKPWEDERDQIDSRWIKK